MRVYVDELPKSKEECSFCDEETNKCRMCGMECHIKDCKYLVPLIVVIEEAETKEEGETENESDDQAI